MVHLDLIFCQKNGTFGFGDFTGEDIDAIRKKDLEKKSEAVLSAQNKAHSQGKEEKVKIASVSKEK
jgi:hypothetical protein